MRFLLLFLYSSNPSLIPCQPMLQPRGMIHSPPPRTPRFFIPCAFASTWDALLSPYFSLSRPVQMPLPPQTLEIIPSPFKSPQPFICPCHMGIKILSSRSSWNHHLVRGSPPGLLEGRTPTLFTVGALSILRTGPCSGRFSVDT